MANITDKIKNGISYAVRGADVAKKVSRVAKKNSIMRMAAPGIFQYQYMGPDDIEADVQLAICQALQLQYASAVCTAFSLNPEMALKKYENISDFVQSFHKNGDMPTNTKALMTLAGESSIDVDAIEDADVTGAVVDNEYQHEALASLALECWSDTESSLDMESFNDIYRPYDRTLRIKTEKLAALEASFSQKFANVGKRVDLISKGVNGLYEKGFNANDDLEGPHSGSYVAAKVDYNTGKIIMNKDGTPQLERRYLNRDRTFKNEVVHVNKLEAMEPTMVNVSISCHGGTGDGQWNQTVTIGVKVMPRIVKTPVLTTAVADMCKSTHHLINRILKFTKGEKKTLDFLFGVTASKKKAIQANVKQEIQVIEQQKRRKKLAKAGKVTGEGIFPILTIVITTYQADKIKELVGMDLTNAGTAKKLMDEYYLLAFGVYDTEQHILQILFDGDTNWALTSIGAMKSMMTKTTDLLNQRQLINLFGRS